MIGALFSAFIIASLSIVSALFFGKRERVINSHHFILPVAVGTFLGIVFFELIPETLEASHDWGPIVILAGFFGFYLLSHVLDTYHHHHAHAQDACAHNSARMLLVGDGIHNLADGIVIGSAFILNPIAGVLTTIGIALHEIPQEIAEFGILMRSGCTRTQAIFYNFLSASSVFVGVLVAFAFFTIAEQYLFILTGVAAGNLLYIASSDLIPELRQSHKNHFMKTFFATLLGTCAIAILITYTHTFIDTI